jgi:hypothetical protein
MTAEMLAALPNAAQAKGSPLTDAERAQVYVAGDTVALRARFMNVIRLAGYKDGTKICDEWFPKYISGDRAEFIEMLQDYEKRYS